MTSEALVDAAQMLLSDDKGLLAIDESNTTCNERFAQLGIPQTDSLRRVVPAVVAGIAFLSGGQSPELASARLNAINSRAKEAGSHAPWPLTFSFARAIQQPALQIWQGKEAKVMAAQQALYQRAHLNRLARLGEYTDAMETA